jgi:hypothetical protein
LSAQTLKAGEDMQTKVIDCKSKKVLMFDLENFAELHELSVPKAKYLIQHILKCAGIDAEFEKAGQPFKREAI